MDEAPSDEARAAEVVLVYFEGCPHWCTALERLDEALGRVGRSDSVRLQRVANDAEARQHHMAGSPTILIDGQDPFPGGVPSWGCPLYPGEAGAQGAPSVKSLVELLS